MKGVLFVFAVSALSMVCFSKPVYNKEVWRARNNGAEFDVMFKVVDDEGSPVANARCGGWAYMEHAHGHGCGYAVFTDTNGNARVTGKCSEWFSVVVRKDGYYKTSFDVKYPIENVNPPIVDGKWQPYGETRTVVLKRILRPHEMYNLDSPPQRKISIYDKWLGFDLEKGDFLPPMGNGVESDMLVRFHLAGEMPHDWSKTMDVSFTNYPYAGAYLVKKDVWSDMKSVYSADTNALYLTDFSFRYAWEKGSRRPIVEKLMDDEYLVFRTRTKVDHEGRLISARYGKLYGPWRFEDAGGSQIYQVFLNKADNDVNLEDTWTIENAKKYKR